MRLKNIMINGKIGYLSYRDHTMEIKRKVGKRTDMILNLKLINLLKIGELVWN